MKKKLLKIINSYGIKNQQRKLAEEVFELQEAITEEQCEGSDYDYSEMHKNHIAEELADVLVMLTQIKEYYRIDTKLLQEIMKYKINRTLGRMENDLDERKI